MRVIADPTLHPRDEEGTQGDLDGDLAAGVAALILWILPAAAEAVA